MLCITIPATECWDEKNNRFVDIKEHTLQLEHSLVSISKWESRWHKPFLHTETMTTEETIDYIKCMTITQNVNPDVYNNITVENIEEIKRYIQDPMTATTFSNDKQRSTNREIVTAELIYYWMISLNIPPEYRKWHLNQLLTLIRVCNVKNAPPKKMGREEQMSRQRALNEARRKKYNSNG